eukprot:GFUD01007673.1.p1 GENE.GFUD01007673.1~~GFUD01007673.1.p1  ORF type:complete len:1388 (+),score=342.68 GFUD01007673.1:44-4207(+)
MADTETPTQLLCPICRTILKNAVQLPCCTTCTCRTCALKKLMTTKKRCWVNSTESCKNAIQLDQLTPADDVRKLVEDFKGGGTLYKEKNEPKEIVPEEPVVDVCHEIPVEEIILNPEIVVKKEPVDFDSGEILFSGDSELSAKIAEKSAELRARLAQCKLSGGAVVGGEVSEKAKTEGKSNKDSEKSTIVCKKDSKTSEFNLKDTKTSKTEEHTTTKDSEIHLKTSDLVISELELNDIRNVIGEISTDPEKNYEEYGEESMETSQIEAEYGEEEYGESSATCEAEEYSESSQKKSISIKSELLDPSSSQSTSCLLCHRTGHDLSSCPEVKCKNCGASGHALFNCPDKFSYSAPNSVESALSGDHGNFSPKKEPGLCTPTSSGYWSDDAKEGPYFGKLRWNSESKTNGYVEIVLDNCETREVHVSGYDVKCGAENGDLVEFVLGNDTQHGKAAKRVKLVEKGLPVSEADQIRGQYSLKRSLEISAGLCDGDSTKKMRTDDIIDMKAEINSMSDYSDIAELDDISADIKSEREYDDIEDEEVYDHCVCDKRLLVRCQLCPFYFLEAKSSHTLLEGESITILAKIHGNEGDLKQELKFVRHIPYPFKFLNQTSFELIKELGRKSLTAKVTPVFYQDHVFVTLQNPVKKQVTVNPGDILGICQSETILRSEVSSHFMFEPPTRQKCHDIPVYAKRGDFSVDENQIFCGFGTLGKGDMNYKHCLVKLILRPEFERKFTIVKPEVTVQIKHNIWLEIESLRGKTNFERAIPKDGCIGYASSIMDEENVKEMVAKFDDEVRRKQQEWRDEHVVGDVKNEVSKRDPKADQNAYDEMLTQIDKDMKVNHVNFKKELKLDESLTDRVFKGTVGENMLIIPPKATVETNLFLLDEDDLNLKSLLKFKAKVSNNEEFKYYNNCYNIEEQVVTIVNGICRVSKTTRPCVKVKISNPRTDNTCLKRDSAIALVKIHIETVKPAPKKTPNYMQDISPVIKQVEQVTTKPVPSTQRKHFNSMKYLDKTQRRFARKWEQICGEKTFQKSLMVEEKFPYFKSKPKIPFGMKDSNELNMRIGINQDSRPVKVLDRVNGVFTCTICDVVILDRYSLQDHWYAAKHKQNMKLVQVIAGLDERMFMNRPVVQEMLEQFILCPLIGLDHVFEILRGREEPHYHCALCNMDSGLTDLVPHVTSLSHILTFIKEFFPLAWGRFSPIPDFSTWSEADFECLDLVVNKVDLVHGRKKPSLVASIDKLEEHVDKIPINSYNTRRTELDTFFKTLKPAEPPQNSHPEPHAHIRQKRIITRLGAVTQTVEIGPGSSKSVALKILGPAKSSLLAGRFVQVNKNLETSGPSEVKPGLARVWVEANSSETCVRTTLVNKLSTSSVVVQKNSELALITWRQ